MNWLVHGSDQVGINLAFKINQRPQHTTWLTLHKPELRTNRTQASIRQQVAYIELGLILLVVLLFDSGGKVRN